jgi:uncharacterized repeat protein (TIGR02543 family)
MRGWLGLLLAVLVVGVAGAPAAAAAPPPALTVEVIGQGTVTGTGVNCGLGSLSCYSAFGSSSQTVALTATPASGWTFDHWEDSASSCATASSCSVTVNAAKTATAIFAFSGSVATSTLAVSPSNGAVTNGSGNYSIDCDPDEAVTAPATPPTACSLTVVTGSTLAVTETPDAGYLFNGWGGSCGGTGPSCAVYLQSNQSVSAGFVAVGSNTLTVTVAGSGSVSGGGISCGAGATCSAPEPSNSSVTLTEAPASGYVFTGWSSGCTGQQATCTVQMTAAATVTATFAQAATLSVTVSGNGYVTGGGIGCDGGQTCTASETPSTTVTLTAHPNGGGSVFWSGCTSTAGTLCTVTVGTTVQSVTATFSGGGAAPPIATNTLTVTVEGDGYVVSSAGSTGLHCTAAGGAGCSTSVAANTTVTLSAVSASGNSADFQDWVGDCSAFTSTSCTLTMNTSRTVEADFAGGDTTYILSGQVTGSGTISGAGLSCTSLGGGGCSEPQAAGATVTLTATPSAGATFGGWGGACSGTSSSCAVSMTNAKSVTATFSASSGKTSTSLTIAVSGAGTVDGPGGACTSTKGKDKVCTQPVTAGKAVTLAAKPGGGFALSGWTGACSGKKAECELASASGESVGATFVELALGATHTPTVVKTKAGYRITLWFHTARNGSLVVTATRSGKSVLRHKVAVKAGGRHALVTVSRRGRYVVTLTLAGHSLRWRVKV